MKNSKLPSPAIPPHDYRPALQGALSWLGKRHLLAEPVNRRSEERREFSAVPAALRAS